MLQVLEKEMITDAVFWLLCFLTIGPGLLELYFRTRQINMLGKSNGVPPRLLAYLSEEKFTHLRENAVHDEYLKILKTAVYTIFITSLELCLGLLPYLWKKAENYSKTSVFLRNDEILTGIYFTIFLCLYDSLKSLIWSYVDDLIFQQYYYQYKVFNFSILCRTAVYLTVKLAALIPISIIVTLLGKNAGDYFFLWAWLYSCLIAIIAVIVGWPLCFLTILYQMEPFPRGHLWSKIEDIARSLGFPPMEILVARRNLLTYNKSLTTTAGVLCIRRIIISDDFLVNATSAFLPTSYSEESMKREASASIASEDNDEGSSTPKKKTTFIDSTVERQSSVSSMSKDGPRPSSRASRWVTPLLNERKTIFNAQRFYFTEKNIVAIVIHELGHWQCSHNIKKLLSIIFVKFFWFAILGQIVKLDYIFLACGFEEKEMPLVVGCIIYTFYVSGFFIMAEIFAYNSLCRYQEYEADSLIVEMDYTQDMAELLIKRFMTNYIFPFNDKWYGRYFKRYPTLLSRLANLDVLGQYNNRSTQV